MPSLPSPNEFLESVPTPGGSFCGKLSRAFNLNLLAYRIYSYFVGDDRKMTVEGAAFICQFNCGGTGTGTTGLAAPVISASDGAFLDKVRVTWSGVAGATSYEVYRNTIDNSATAVLIGTVTNTSFDDTDVTVGSVYVYWVKAKDATQTSPFSNSDSGFVASPIDAITNLDATRGWSVGTGSSYVTLVWTPPALAERYDIYRHTEDNFAAATKIDSDRVPFDNSLSFSTGPTPTFVDNGGELAYYDEPPSKFQRFFYWVVSKAGSGASISVQSNTAEGWAVGDGSGVLPLSSGYLQSGSSEVVPAGAVRAWVVLFGAGGGGAGSGAIYGGGGGGGGAVAFGKYAAQAAVLPAVARLRVISTPEADTSNAGATVNGSAGATSHLQYAPDGTTYAIVMSTSGAPGGGLYNSAGGGLGGAGGSGSVGGSVTDGGTRSGRSGGAAMGVKGGRSGYSFGQTRHPPGHFLGAQAGSYRGDGTTGNPAGAGSYANPNVAQATNEGGKGIRGRAVIVYYAS